MAAWLARRTFGPGAGAAAAAFAALSGPHIAFSRMALTDASFLLFWLVAIGLGQRFLERPNPARAVSLGLAVGLAQLFKYNGWISGVIVAASAVVWLLFHPREWRTRSMAATWGWGLLAAIVAAVVYWPWFRFVESHGGYAALLAHQRSYLGGLSSWPGHWSLQLAQERFLSGGPVWLACAGLAAALAMLISTGDFDARAPSPAENPAGDGRPRGPVLDSPDLRGGSLWSGFRSRSSRAGGHSTKSMTLWSASAGRRSRS